MNCKVGNIVKVRRVSIDNQVGGTKPLQKTVYAKIVDSFHDYEVGQRFIGELFREEDIKASKDAGKTKFIPENYKKYGEKMYQDTLKAYNEYDPKKVYFTEHAIISVVKDK